MCEGIESWLCVFIFGVKIRSLRDYDGQVPVQYKPESVFSRWIVPYPVALLFDFY